MSTSYLALELELDVISTDEFFLNRQVAGYLIGILKHEAPQLVHNGIVLYVSNDREVSLSGKKQA